METETKELRGLGGNAWQTMSGTDINKFFTDLNGIAGVSIMDALQDAAFLVCCDILAQDISKAPIGLFKMMDDGGLQKVKPKKHHVASLFATEPNARHTWREFMEMQGYWYSLRTNSYAYLKRNRVGDVTDIVPLQSSRVIDLANHESGEIFYEVSAANWQEQALLGFQSKRVPERDIIHVRGRMLDGFAGLSTMTVGQKTLGLSASISDFQSNLFEEDGQLRGVFTKKDGGTLDEVAFARLKDQFTTLMRNFRRNNVPIVLEDGLEFQAISSKPSDLEISKLLEIAIVNNCRLLRIPPHKAFHLVNVKYENMEVLEKSYIGDTLEPILQNFEQRFARHLLTREERMEYKIRFDRDALQLNDPKVLTEQVTKLYATGSVTQNEVRAKFGMNPIKGGNVRSIPVNAQLVDENNKVVLAPPKQIKPEAGDEDKPDTDTEEQTPEPKKTLRLVTN